MNGIRKPGRAIISMLLGIFIVPLGLFYFGTYHPADVQEEQFFSAENTPLLKPGQHVKVLNWNIQFMAGNTNNHFFFNEGDDPWPSQKTVDHITREVARVILDENPDIILLQEVDDGSVRTFKEDQLAKLMKLLPQEYASHSSSFYWKTSFVPHPAIMGSMGMKLSIISKYKMDGATRYALSPITDQSYLVQQLSIKRALLEARFPIEGGSGLKVLNGHLSAFAQGSDTMTRQIEQVDQILSEMEKNGEYGLIGGDFNLLTPGNAYGRLSKERQGHYNPDGSELTLLFDQYKAVPTLEEVDGAAYKKWQTAMSTRGSTRSPDITLDFLFFTSALQFGDHYVRSHDTLPISDHLPLISWVTLPSTIRN